jgi:hypothetical protein
MNRIARIALVTAAALAAACNRPAALPDMGVSRAEVSFEAPGGSGDPAPQTVYVVNTGRGSLAAPAAGITYQQGGSWLAATVTGGGAPYGVELHATSAGLDPGVYRATVTLTCSNASASPAQVTVTLTVPDPRFTLSVQSLAIDAPRGGGDPAPATFQVLNAGRGTIPVPQVDVAYVGVSGWLMTAVGGTSAAYTVTASAQVAGMASGVYTATLTVRAAGAEVPPRTLEVKLTVPPPELALSSTQVRIVGPKEAADPAPVIVPVTNAGGGRLAAPTVTVAYDASYAEFLEATVTAGTGAPFAIVLQAHQRYSVPGFGVRPPMYPRMYGAKVTVTSEGAVAPVTIDVTLVVPPPVIQVSADHVSWSEASTCALPAPVVVKVTNGGGYTLRPPTVTTAPGAAGWLSATTPPWGVEPYDVTLALAAFPPVDATGRVSTTVSLVDPAGLASPVDLVVSFQELPSDLAATRVTPSALRMWAQVGMGDPLARTVALRTPEGCLKPPTIAVDYAAPTDPAWLSAALASYPHAHDVTVLTSAAGMAAGDVRAATLRLTAPGYTAQVPVTLTAGAPAATGAMPVARASPTVIPLADGRALATGGRGKNGWANWSSDDVALFDPYTGTWTALVAMTTLRMSHGGAELDDGQIVICGGTDTTHGLQRADDTCEMRSLTAMSSGAPPLIWHMQSGREYATVVPMPRGRILVVSPDAAPEVIDLATYVSTTPAGVQGASAVTLRDGRILVAGGYGDFTRRAWLYSPGSDLWSPAGTNGIYHWRPALLPLPDGRVLALDGGVGDGAEIWDPVTNTWSATGGPQTNHSPLDFTLLASGKVAAFDGALINAGRVGEIEVFDPTAGSWTIVGSLPGTPRREVAVARLASGMILIAGGYVQDVGFTSEVATW